MRGAAVARRRWQRRYRCLRRAQPGLASRRQTRPDPAGSSGSAVLAG